MTTPIKVTDPSQKWKLVLGLVALAIGAYTAGAALAYLEDIRDNTAPDVSHFPTEVSTATIALWPDTKVTAYTSDPAETDDTPHTTASGTRTRPGVAANNCLPFGTKVRIAGETYVIEDRMNERYGCKHFDVWMESKEAALAWGVRRTRVLFEFSTGEALGDVIE